MGAFSASGLRPLGISCFAAALLALVGCGWGGGHGTGEHSTLPVTRPLRTSSTVTREYVAQVRAVQHIELRAMERGYLQDILVDEGQLVREGQKLFQIMPRLYEAELQRAAAEADFASIEFRNTQALQARDVVSPNELALDKARLDKANAEVALARAHLDLAEIKAPFEGLMGRLEVRRGSLLEEGELLSTLADTSEMWVYFNLSETEYLAFMEESRDADAPQPVRLRMANGRLFPHEGQVTAIESDFDSETGNIAFRATFPNPDRLLRHGETGKVMRATTLDDVLLVPQKATYDILDKRFVYVLDGEDHVHAREIRVLEELPHVYVVGEGLEETDRILLDGLRRVHEGDHVTPHFEEPAQVLAHLDLPTE